MSAKFKICEEISPKLDGKKNYPCRWVKNLNKLRKDQKFIHLSLFIYAPYRINCMKT